MSDLTGFLLARIAEDEAVANAAIDDDGGEVGGFEDSADRLTWQSHDPQPNRFGAAAASLIAHTAVPRRVLAECEAKRRIVKRHTLHPHYPVCEWCYVSEPDFRAAPWPCVELRDVATVYADHPDYDKAWRP